MRESSKAPAIRAVSNQHLRPCQALVDDKQETHYCKSNDGKANDEMRVEGDELMQPCRHKDRQSLITMGR